MDLAFLSAKDAPLQSAVLPPSSGHMDSVVVFVHGYGADGRDLIGLGQSWQDQLPNTLLISPNAPEACGMNPSGYQWFGLSDLSPKELSVGVYQAAPVLNAYLDYVLEQTKLPSEKLFLVGFSQGTMMSLHVGMRRPDPIGGIVGFSGALASPETLENEMTQKPSVLLVHGDADPVVPVFLLQAAVENLKNAGVMADWHVCPGLPHGIDPKGMELGAQFLTTKLSA